MTQGTEQTKRTNRRVRTGVVAAISGDKTVRVTLMNLVKHPMYGKYIKRRTKLTVHDQANESRVGDMVEITPCRRLSKRKSWRVLKVVRSAEGSIGAAELEGADS